MPFDEDAEDQRSEAGIPLPPEDRLWRHPSELGKHGGSFIGPVGGPFERSWPGSNVLNPSASAAGARRGAWASVAAVSCLAGAVITMGVVLATRPTTKVVDRRGGSSLALRPVTSLVWKPFPTEQVAAKVSPAVARLDVQGPKGWQQPASAVLVHRDGTLVTSAEIVRASRKLVVTFDDGRHRAAHLAGVDTQTGIAVLTVSLGNRKAALVAAIRPKIGQPMVMVGGPGPGSRLGTVTTGNVRGLGRQMDWSGGALHDLIETDRPVLDDTTGGALVDADGRVLGICLRGKATALGYAVPIDLVRKVADALRKGGRVHWGRLGVEATDIDPGRAQELGIPGAARLETVEDNSPAARAGLMKGDLVTQLGSTEVEAVTDLVAALSEHHPGDVVLVEFRHGTQSRSVRVTLATD